MGEQFRGSISQAVLAAKRYATDESALKVTLSGPLLGTAPLQVSIQGEQGSEFVGFANHWRFTG